MPQSNIPFSKISKTASEQDCSKAIVRLFIVQSKCSADEKWSVDNCNVNKFSWNSGKFNENN